MDACRHDFEQAAAFDQHRNAAKTAMQWLQKLGEPAAAAHN